MVRRPDLILRSAPLGARLEGEVGYLTMRASVSKHGGALLQDEVGITAG
jgi:hypothetical protein